MSENPKLTPLRPILPRNMTARADYLVPGNPMIARPESGVGNAHPGLEFDVRVLESYFMPGLVFGFPYAMGARLMRIDPPFDTKTVLTAADIDKGVFLWALKGAFGDAPDTPKTIRLLGVDGYMVIRRLMDLEAGPIAVLAGTLPQGTAQGAQVDDAIAAFAAGKMPVPPAGVSCDHFAGERSAFLDKNGVIDPERIAPGELTANLCSPWQWDFADCYCYYWASSKPDVVVGIGGDAQVLNFQRDRNAPDLALPATTSTDWRAQNITDPDMIRNWGELPVVLSEREGMVPRAPAWPRLDDPFATLDDVARELRRLAGLEHALCVEYLYAKFSINAPVKQPSGLAGEAKRRFQAAREVFNIAVDEMRHLRWANEALWILGAPPSLERATTVGSDLRRFFELRPLTPKVLDEFIGIEAPASIFNDDPQQLDSIYSKIQISLNQMQGADPDCVLRLQQLVKVIIDEGKNHWERFRGVKACLAGMKPQTYLRYLSPPPPATQEPWATLQALCDAYYDLLLHALYVTFRLGRRSRGFWLSVSHHAMFALDNAGYLLSEQGFAPRFTLPAWVGAPAPAFAASAVQSYGSAGPTQLKNLVGNEDAIVSLFKKVEATLALLADVRPSAVRRMAAGHREQMERMKALFLGEYREGKAARGEAVPHGRA